MKYYLISDTHLKHENMKTYCDRPSDFTERIHKNIFNLLTQHDCLIHLGDVGIGKYESWDWMIRAWPGKKVLIRGNHDRQRSTSWWMQHGFDFACDGMLFRDCWLSHEPSTSLSVGTLNIHGHLHNIWHGFAPNAGDERDATERRRLRNSWQRLFALEYTNFMPVEFDKFVGQPDKYQARGPKKEAA